MPEIEDGSGMRIPHPILRIACWFSIASVPLFFAVRGLDLTDTGFVLTNQRFVFSHPESVHYWFHLWLTNVFGGLVDLALGGFGVLPHKIAAAFIFWAIVGGVFAFYRGVLKRDLVLFGLVVSMAFCFAGKINIVHYNNLSALLYVVGGALLVRAALTRKSSLFALAGFTLGMNVFARLPNIVGLGLVFVPFILNLITADRDRRLALRPRHMLFFFAGVLAAIFVAFAAMSAFGHLRYYLDSLKDLTESSVKDAGSYGKGKLIKRPVRDTFYSFLYGVPLVVVLALISGVVSSLRPRILRVMSLVIVAALAFIALPLVEQEYGERFILRASAGLGYWAAFAVVMDKQSGVGLRLAAALAACLSLAMNVGSDTGIAVSTYVFPTLFPTALAAAERFVSLWKSGSPGRSYRPLSTLGFAIVALYFGFSVRWIGWNVYRDTSNLERTVDNAQLRGVFTSENRAVALERDIAAISRYAKPGDLLYVHDSLPLFHFVTRTRPYLGNPWPALYAETYLDTLLRKEESRGPLPAVVLAKCNARSGWPSSPLPPIAVAPVKAFLVRNAYRLVWESPSIEIYSQ